MCALAIGAYAAALFAPLAQSQVFTLSKVGDLPVTYFDPGWRSINPSPPRASTRASS